MMKYHNPVLKNEVVQGLSIDPEGTYVDATFGGGGHSSLILDKLGPKGKLFSFDQDNDSIINSINDSRFKLVNSNFTFINNYLKLHKIDKINGVLADFGVSSHQINSVSRGFSTRSDSMLDMRMNKNQSLNAYSVINEYDEQRLTSIFFNYGELRNAKSYSKVILEKRIIEPIATTFQLKKTLKELVPSRFENKIFAQLFQSIRIEVNNELDVLKEFLKNSCEILLPKGRMVCISYHSLEDRIVKRFINSGKFNGDPEKDFYGNVETPLKKIGKLIIPSQNEIEENNRSRSAKLRIGEKK